MNRTHILCFDVSRRQRSCSTLKSQINDSSYCVIYQIISLYFLGLLQFCTYKGSTQKLCSTCILNLQKTLVGSDTFCMFTVVYVAAKWVRMSSFFIIIINVNVFRRKHRKCNVVVIVIFVFITESEKDVQIPLWSFQ